MIKSSTMEDIYSDPKVRPTKTSTTIFLHHKNEYLFVKRSEHATINAGQTNGIGGKLDPGEDFITAAIRETEEETGYKVNPSDISFCGVVKFESQDREDWVTCYYKVPVDSKIIPIGHKTREGDLIWVHKDKILETNNLVESTRCVFPEVISGQNLFFLTLKVKGDNFQIVNKSLQLLTRK